MQHRAAGEGGERRKGEPVITAGWLERYALWYLERWPASTAKLRRALLRRVERSAAFHEVDPAPGRAMVESEIGRLADLGLLDDARLAEHKAARLQRRGTSRAQIRSKLFAAQIPQGAIEAAVRGLQSDDPEVDPDLEAARTWARKRRIGPWRRGPVDREGRQKELAKLARAGFGFDVARRVIDGADELGEEVDPG